MANDTSENTDTFQGRFIELVPYEKIVEAIEFESQDPRFAGQMKITTSFSDTDGGTEVTVLCQDIPAGIRPEDNEMDETIPAEAGCILRDKGRAIMSTEMQGNVLLRLRGSFSLLIHTAVEGTI